MLGGSYHASMLNKQRRPSFLQPPTEHPDRRYACRRCIHPGEHILGKVPIRRNNV